MPREKLNKINLFTILILWQLLFHPLFSLIKVSAIFPMSIMISHIIYKRMNCGCANMQYAETVSTLKIVFDQKNQHCMLDVSIKFFGEMYTFFSNCYPQSVYHVYVLLHTWQNHSSTQQISLELIFVLIYSTEILSRTVNGSLAQVLVLSSQQVFSYYGLQQNLVLSEI